MGSKISSNRDKSTNDNCDNNINDESYKKYHQIKMERCIQLHYQIHQRENAVKLARDRELFYWLSAFYVSSLWVCASYYQRMKHSAVLLPLLPLTFATGYYGDLAYGSKIHRIRAEADMIMTHEAELLHWPAGLPTVAAIDEARVEVEMEKKMHPHQS